MNRERFPTTERPAAGSASTADGAVNDATFHERQSGFSPETDRKLSEESQRHEVDLMETRAHEVLAADPERGRQAFEALCRRFPKHRRIETWQQLAKEK